MFIFVHFRFKIVDSRDIWIEYSLKKTKQVLVKVSFILLLFQGDCYLSQISVQSSPNKFLEINLL